MQQYLPFLTFLAPFALFYKQTQAFFLRLVKMGWKSRELSYKLAIPFYRELKKYKCYDFDNYRPRLLQVFDKTANDVKSVVAKAYYHEIYFYKGFIPVSVIDSAEGTTFSYLKYTFPFEKILSKIIEQVQPEVYESYHYIEEVRGTSRNGATFSSGATLSQAGSSPQSSPAPKRPIIDSSYDMIDQKLGKLVFDQVDGYTLNKPNDSLTKYVFTKQGETIKSQVIKWRDAQEWYERKSIRYYRGLLLKSDPGQGKSALIHEIAKEAKLPLFIVDLSSFDNKELSERIKSLNYSKGILVFEDIDCVWNGRTNLNKTDLEKGVTFDCFLNILSGADAIKNKFVFLTSNHAYALDPALIRPGRIDEIIELEPLTLDDKRRVGKVILEDNDKVEELLLEGANDSTSAWENRCVMEALKIYWN